MTDVPAADESFREVQLERFRVSVLKQAKWQRALPRGRRHARETRPRSRHGQWRHLAALSPEGRHVGERGSHPHAMRAIGRTLGEAVEEIRDARLPYPDATFDLIVVADMLEHVAGRSSVARRDRAMPQGWRPRGAQRAAPQAAGHAAPAAPRDRAHRCVARACARGYDARALRHLLPSTLRLARTHEYVRFFSYALDTSTQRDERARAGAAP